MIAFTIPGEPRGWARTRLNNGRPFKDAKTRGYQNLVRTVAKAHGARPVTGPVRISITAHFAMPKRLTRARRQAIEFGSDYPTKKPDIDNVVKAILDALNGLAFSDDAQVVVLSARKEWAVDASVHVCIHQIAAGEEEKEAA